MKQNFALVTYAPLPKIEYNLLPDQILKIYNRLAARFFPIKTWASLCVENCMTGWLLKCPWQYEDNFSLPPALLVKRLLNIVGKAKKLGANILGWSIGNYFAEWAGWLQQQHSLYVLTGQALDIYASIEIIKYNLKTNKVPPQKIKVLVAPFKTPAMVVLARLLAREFANLTLGGGNEFMMARIADQ